MADFVQTMKDWRRMCKVYTVFKHECEGCPLENIAEHACGAIFEPEFADVVNWQKLEGIVGKWAAEHPEPVYPTWKEWFVSMGMLPDTWDNPNSGIHYIGCLPDLMRTPIPADIAQKLEIEPKEE